MIAAHLAGVLQAAASRAFSVAAVPAFTVERPRDPALGDFASNMPLMLAKHLGRSPLAVAEALAAAVAPDAAIATVRAAAPGFLNFRLQDAWLAEQLRSLLTHGVRLPAAEHGGTFEATYSAPPPGPLRPADARQAVWGDVLVRLLRAVGRDVPVRHVLPSAWAVLDASTHAEALGALTDALSAVGVVASSWEAVAPAKGPQRGPEGPEPLRVPLPGANVGGWQLKKAGVSADHVITGVGAPMSVVPAEAGGSLGAIRSALGADGFRWLAVSRAQHLPLTIDLTADTQETLRNPLFLIPYTHARLAGLERLARQAGMGPFEGVPTWSDLERRQLLRVVSYPDMVADAAEAGAPHRLTRYLEELVAGFHQVDARHRVFGQPTCEAQARLGLIQGTRLVLAHGLGELLGMTPPEHLA